MPESIVESDLATRTSISLNKSTASRLGKITYDCNKNVVKVMLCILAPKYVQSIGDFGRHPGNACGVSKTIDGNLDFY